MIHQSYTSSIISLRTSFSFNDYAYCSNERCPSSYCSCCCSFSINSPRFIVPINPSFLYGLRQSTLIQWPPSRRLILGSGDRYCFRSPVSDVGRCCNVACCCVKRDRVERNLGTICKEECCVKKMRGDVNVNKIRGRTARRSYQSSAVGDAEAMLSLLTECTVEECLHVRERRSSYKDGNAVWKQNVVCEDSKHRKENSGSGCVGGWLSRYQLEISKVQSKEDVDERRDETEVCLKEEERRSRRKESSSGNLGSQLDKLTLESNKVKSREEDHKRREDREDILKEERWSRRNESSSSYYSASDLSDSESDVEVEIRDERFVGESSTRHRKDSRQIGSVVISEKNKRETSKNRDERDQRLQSSEHGDLRVRSSTVSDSRKKSEGIVTSEVTTKDSKRYIDERNQQQQTSRHDDFLVGSSTEWDWRKKSEKRLTEESAEETKSSKDSVVRHSHKSQAYESNSMKASKSEKQFNYEEEESTSGVSFHGQLRSHVRKDNQVSNYSKSSVRHDQSTQTARHHVETTSDMQTRSNQGEEGMVIVGQSVQETGCQYCKTCGRTIQQNMTQTGFQPRPELSQIRDDESSISTIQGHSESRLKKQEKSSALLQTSVQETNEQRDQMTHMVTSQVNTQRKLQHYGETVDTLDNYVESTSSSQEQYETRMKNLEGNSSLLRSTQEMKGPPEKSSGKFIEETQSSRVAQSGIRAAQIHTTNVEINRQSASEQHIYNDQIYLTKRKSEEELEEKHKYIDETVAQSRVRTEVRRPIAEAAYTVTFPGEASESQPSTVLIIQTGVQQVSGEEANSALQLSTSSPSGEAQRPIAEAGYTRNFSGEASESQSCTALIIQTGVQQVSEEKANFALQLSTPSPSVEVQRPIAEVGYTGSFSVDASESQPSTALITQTVVHQVSEEQANFALQLSTSSPSGDPLSSSEGKDSGGIAQVETGSLYIYSPPRTLVSGEVPSGSEYYVDPSQEHALGSAEHMEESSIQIVGGFVEEMRQETSISLTRTELESTPAQRDSKHQAGTSGLYLHPQAITPSSSDEGSGSRSESYEEPSLEYALVSAEHVEGSAVQIVGEFVEKMQHEASTSQSTRMKKQSKLDPVHQDEIYMLKGSTQSDSEKTIIQKPESRRSSGGSESKGPSDEMWDAKDHFVQESSEMESLEGSTSENLSVRRTGKFLWNVVAGIFQRRWSLHAETQGSSVKAGGHGSSNESASGEVSSSKDEADEANGGSMKNRGLPEEQTSSVQPLQRRTFTKSRRQDLEVMILDDGMRHAEASASSSLNLLPTGSLSGDISSGANTNWNVSQQLSQSMPPLDLTIPPASSLIRSHVIEEIEEAAHTEGLIESTGEQGVQSVDVRQTGLEPASKLTDADVKQRKLQRSNQVLNERYDEWEIAFRLEREQRKVDEIFMREALVEAKKAADSWEVPVGAVLVQNGNVIARGYNLVEELRDSTAHAEMICIREASNVLKTWRLSETTLYVTLEPCPMCAGAILQARVGTLVWGAPNKLLGADGSWIRLFPGGVEGEERPEVAEKPAAPIHPFHPNMKIRRGVLEEECADIMHQFFQLRRRKKKKSEESSQKPRLFHKMLKFPVIHKKHSS